MDLLGLRWLKLSIHRTDGLLVAKDLALWDLFSRQKLAIRSFWNLIDWRSSIQFSVRTFVQHFRAYWTFKEWIYTVVAVLVYAVKHVFDSCLLQLRLRAQLASVEVLLTLTVINLLHWHKLDGAAHECQLADLHIQRDVVPVARMTNSHCEELLNHHLRHVSVLHFWHLGNSEPVGEDCHGLLARSQINSVSFIRPSAFYMLSKLVAARKRKRDIIANCFSLECAELGNPDSLVALLGKQVSQIFRETAP